MEEVDGNGEVEELEVRWGFEVPGIGGQNLRVA